MHIIIINDVNDVMPFGITGLAGIFIEDNVTVWNKNSNDTVYRRYFYSLSRNR